MEDPKTLMVCGICLPRDPLLNSEGVVWCISTRGHQDYHIGILSDGREIHWEFECSYLADGESCPDGDNCEDFVYSFVGKPISFYDRL